MRIYRTSLNKTNGRTTIGGAMLMVVLLLLNTEPTMAQEEVHHITAAWWNVENLFDTRDDPKTNDDDFTPKGDYHWTNWKLRTKLQGIFKTIAMMELPDVVGLAEVENAYVLRELTRGTPLSQVPYRYVHYDSPDRRGIDCALIYRSDRYSIDSSYTVSLSDSTAGYYTRDILVVEGHTSDGESLSLLLNHWPSKRGGDDAEEHRMMAAQRLREEMNALHKRHPEGAVVAMGDMNSTADEAPIAEGMGFGSDSVNAEGIRLLTQRMPKDWGSHKYQGEWRYIDQLMLLADESWMVRDAKVMRFDHLLTEEKRRPGQRPLRTNQGMRYEGGVSDHLPLLLRLKRGSINADL